MTISRTLKPFINILKGLTYVKLHNTYQTHNSVNFKFSSLSNIYLNVRFLVILQPHGLCMRDGGWCNTKLYSHIVWTPLSMYIHVRDDVTPASTEIIQHQSQRRFKIKKKLTAYNNVAFPHAQTANTTVEYLRHHRTNHLHD